MIAIVGTQRGSGERIMVNNQEIYGLSFYDPASGRRLGELKLLSL